MAGYVEAEDAGYGKILKKPGKYKMGAGCDYINELDESVKELPDGLFFCVLIKIFAFFA